MIATSIELTDRTPQWGLVTVIAEDGTVDRAYAITDAQEVAVREDQAMPPGCTKEEWESGRVTVNGRPCLPGQAMVNPDGTLVLNGGYVQEGRVLSVRLFRIPPAEWALVGGVVMVDSTVAAALGD